MKLAAMQPYFFPYLGYFGLIKHSDRFLIGDNVQFMKGGWIARNRMLKQEQGWQYIGVPLVKHPLNTIIKDVKIFSEEPWQEKIFKQLLHYKRKAPYYEEVIRFLQRTLAYRTESISDLDTHVLAETCNYIGIPFRALSFDDLDFVIESVNAPDEWALNICNAIGADTYINPPGGMEFYDRSKYAGAGISLQFLKVNLRPYDQRREPFEEGLSILDVMMFNTPQQIQGMLDDYDTLE
jgi:hypothetical protein